jgi:hypothetical protein
MNHFQPIIDEVEYYKKGGRVKKLRVKAHKLKNPKQVASKHGVNIYIDNSKKPSRRNKSENKPNQRQPNIISISNPQPSNNNGLNPESFLKLIEKLGQRTGLRENERLIEPEPNLNEVEAPASSSSSSAAAAPPDIEYIPKVHDAYDEYIQLDAASSLLNRYFSEYSELFNRSGAFKPNVINSLARQYGIDTTGLQLKDIKKEIYKKIHGY